jgi:hypothetical protein
MSTVKGGRDVPRRKCFISYHKDDEYAVQAFVNRFDNVQDTFIRRAILMPEDIVNSSDDDYVIAQIRNRFIGDSTVTLVMIGQCTWSRKFVDWEVQASLRQPADGLPNGLLAILLDPNAELGILPQRVKLNHESGYARFYPYPDGAATLSGWIEDAYSARTNRAKLIQNARARKTGNDPCP